MKPPPTRCGRRTIRGTRSWSAGRRRPATLSIRNTWPSSIASPGTGARSRSVSRLAARRTLRNSSASRCGSVEGERVRAMAIKDILVHVDASPAFDPRLHLAIGLARRFDAYVTAVLVLPPIDVLPLAASGPVAAGRPPYLRTLGGDAA